MIVTRLSLLVFAVAAGLGTAAVARNQIQVAGSSTVLPYATIAAEAFGENFPFPAPVVEGGGSSAGLKQFCEGVGENTIDIANASRPIKPAEFAACKANGVANIIEVRIGYDGIVFASHINGRDFALTPKDVYLALAKDVVNDGKIVPNTITRWSQADPALPDQDILAFIPGTKHGTREVFEEQVLLQGCKDAGDLDAQLAAHSGDEKLAKAACMTVRTDGRAVDIDGDYTETLARVESNKAAIGVFGLSFYENNTDRLKVATMNGVVPTTQTIASGEYPVSRPLYFYVKKDHIGRIPGLKEFVAFFVNDAVAGPDGPLAQYGLVSDPNLAEVQKAVADEQAMQ